MRTALPILLLALSFLGCDQSDPGTTEEPPVEDPEFVIENMFVPFRSGEVWLYDRTVSYGSNGSEQANVRLTVIGDTLLQAPRFFNDTLSAPLRYTLIRGEETTSNGTYIPSLRIAARYTDRGLEWFMSGRGGVGGWEPWILPYPNGSPTVTSVRFESPVDTREIEFRCASPSIEWGELDSEQVTTYHYDCEREGVLGIANRYDYIYRPVFVPRVALSSLYQTGFGSYTEWSLNNISR